MITNKGIEKINDTLNKLKAPLTTIDQAELLSAARANFTEAGVFLLRRLLWEVDASRAQILHVHSELDVSKAAFDMAQEIATCLKSDFPGETLDAIAEKLNDRIPQYIWCVRAIGTEVRIKVERAAKSNCGELSTKMSKVSKGQSK